MRGRHGDINQEIYSTQPALRQLCIDSIIKI